MEDRLTLLVWNNLPWIFLYLPLAALVVLCVLCLVKLPGSRRRGLFPVASALAVCAAVLFGGAWPLGWFSLEWRMIPKTVLGTAIWLLGLGAGILTVRYTMRRLNERRPKLALWGAALALYCLISVMGSGSILGGLWALAPSEEVGTWQGRTVVQCAWTFMGSSYQVYEYHGPLVRGADALAWSEEPMIEESGQRAMEQGLSSAGRDLGVSLADGAPLYCEDTHGWMGDGETFLTVAFEAPPEWLADWTPLPLTDNLTRADHDLAGDFFPDIRRGWYFFKDRSAKSTDPADDSGLFSRNSWNFTLAVYDGETDTLYYFALDT